MENLFKDLHNTYLRIYLGEHLLMKYYMIKHLILLKIENMMNINGTSMVLKFFDNFFISSSHANTSGGAVIRANKSAIKIEIMSN